MVKRYEKMIDILQNSASTKLDKPLPSIKRSIDQRNLVFTYVLSSLVDRQLPSKIQHLIRNMHTGNDNGSLESGKPTKTLPDLLIFIDRKNPFINQ